MPKRRSNFSRYKIPDDLDPDGICCITVPVPDDPEWIAQFMGAVWRMSLQTHYTREATHSGAVVAAKWREIWEETQLGNCCGGAADGSNNITLLNIQILQVLMIWRKQYIDAALDITVVFPDTPDDYDADPADTGGELAQRDRALCIAVESWVDELCNRGLQLAEEAGITIASGITAGIVIPLVPAKIVLGGFVAAAFVLSELVSQLVDPAYRQYLKCGMYSALQGESTSGPSSFAESWDNLPSRPPPPESAFEDLARDAIEAWGRSQLNNLDNWLGFIDTLNTAMSVATSITDEDCGCLAEWTHVFDFTIDEQGWTNDAEFCAADWAAHYTAGVGWETTGSSPELSMRIRFDMVTDGTFTEAGNLQSGSAIKRWAVATLVDGCVHNFRSGDLPAGGTLQPFVGTVEASEFLTYIIQATGPGQAQTVTQLTYKGTGINPFL